MTIKKRKTTEFIAPTTGTYTFDVGDTLSGSYIYTFIGVPLNSSIDLVLEDKELLNACDFDKVETLYKKLKELKKSKKLKDSTKAWLK